MKNEQKIKQITGDITPLPWKIENKFSYITNVCSGEDAICQISDLYGRKKHASLTLPDNEYNIAKKWNEQIDEEKKINAAYIVKACNEYPSLKLDLDKEQVRNAELKSNNLHLNKYNDSLKLLNSELVECFEEWIQEWETKVTSDLKSPIDEVPRMLAHLEKLEKIFSKAKELINKAKQNECTTDNNSPDPV